MAEALGLAGSVVGIVSLGIQIAQGLLKYYGAWKDHGNDVANVCASLANLSGTLTILLRTIQPPATFDKRVKAIVEKSINTFDGALEKLKGELKKVEDTESSILRRHVRRALYPFREDTLRKIQGFVSETRSNLAFTLQVLQVDDVSDIRRQVNLIVRSQEDKETRRIVDWISPVNFWLKQVDVSRQRQPGTGQWLLDHPDFLEWEEGIKESLWCRGSPGVGKTVLASVVVEFLESDFPVSSIGLAFIYCNHKQKLSQSVEYFLGIIARQLLERRQAIPNDVRTIHEKHRGKGTRPTGEEYVELLQSLAKECSEVYIVVDALDECINNKGESLWNDLLTQLKRSILNLRLLCTSRHINDIGGVLTGSTHVEIRASNADIEAYIQAQIKSKDRLRRFCEERPGLQNDILQMVASKAEGMFLVAQLHVESLASKHNAAAVRKALPRLPETLDDIYLEAMTRVRQQSEDDKELALQVLSWIVYAVRPLQLAELQHAVAVDYLEPEDRSISEESLTLPSIIVNVCQGMIRVDGKTDTIGLVHYTTQDYFNRKGKELFPDAQRDIGIACLKYLSLDVFSEGYCSTDELYEGRLRENTLLGYAVRNLGNHIREESEQSLHDLALKFLLDERKVSCASQVLLVVKGGWGFRYCQDFPKNFQGVHYVAFLGLAGMIELLFENPNVNPDPKDSYERTPLSYAAQNGSEAAVKQLLANDQVDPNSKDYNGRTPLSWATGKGHEAVVKLLLEKGADVEAKYKDGRTPLSLAAENGDEAIVKLLLEKGADVKAKDEDDGQTPLLWAAENGHFAIVKLLQRKSR
ncbi:hypothetical protein EDB81DRAFT_134285 [Dactylonectria macrodidyma]|uniref:NACHT domain-containing protein n=1 Tax=Dactylonectria macrodidyma TaxID=307937 RepID=A0A9P9IS12_9HYPO|nr:hypothetical protein EDB81DRAFT_134285 [Dactylonectria macrodidyma]